MHPAVSSSAATVRVTSEGVSARLKLPSLALFKRYSPAPDFWNRLFSTVFLNFSVFNVPVSSMFQCLQVLQCLQCSSVFSVPVSSVLQCLEGRKPFAPSRPARTIRTLRKSIKWLPKLRALDRLHFLKEVYPAPICANSLVGTFPGNPGGFPGNPP